MRIRHLLLIVFFIIQGLIVYAQDNRNSIDEYLSNNSKIVRTRCLAEGCNISLSSDDSNMFIQLFVSHPAMQMRLLMQEWTIFIDPTGRKKEKYAIIVPGGQSVKRQLGTMPRPQTPNDGEFSNTRPDHSKLIAALNLYGAKWDVNGGVDHLDHSRFSISVDDEHQAIVYSLLVPKNEMIKEKRLSDNWSFGIFVSTNSMDRPPLQEEPMPSQHERHPIHHENRSPSRNPALSHDIMTKEILEWITVPHGSFNFSSDGNNATLQGNLSARPFTCHASNDNIRMTLSSFNDTVDIDIDVADGENQMLFLMQGLDMSLFSSHDSLLYFIQFPSAKDVHDKLTLHPDQLSVHAPQGVDPSRPDIGYVVDALNTSFPRHHGDISIINFYTSLDTSSITLSYHVQFLVSAIPPNGLLNSITLSSDYGTEMPFENKQPSKSNESRVNVEQANHGKSKRILFLLDCFDNE